jgi:hypothetical protein
VGKAPKNKAIRDEYRFGDDRCVELSETHGVLKVLGHNPPRFGSFPFGAFSQPLETKGAAVRFNNWERMAQWTRAVVSDRLAHKFEKRYFPVR